MAGGLATKYSPARPPPPPTMRVYLSHVARTRGYTHSLTCSHIADCNNLSSAILSQYASTHCCAVAKHVCTRTHTNARAHTHATKPNAPQRLAKRHDVVVVAINYRVGVFGYVHFDHTRRGGGGSGAVPSDDAAGGAVANLGMQDQILVSGGYMRVLLSFLPSSFLFLLLHPLSRLQLCARARARSVCHNCLPASCPFRCEHSILIMPLSLSSGAEVGSS